MKENQNSRKILFIVSSVFLGSALIGGVACTKNDAKARPNFVYKENANKSVVAKIGSEDITLDQLIGDAKLTYLDLQKKLHEFKMNQLKALLEKKLVGQEAKSAGLSIEEFKEKKIFKGKTKPTKKEFDKFVKDRRIPEGQINPQLKERIEAHLGDKKKQTLMDQYLAKLTKKSPVIVHFKKPKMEISVEIGKSPTWGKDKAPVTIVEFSDFQCPFCSRANNTLEQVKKKYKGKVKVAFKHFPLSFHREAKPAAEASMCVNEQSSKKFWKYHDILFQNQRNLDAESLEKYAKQAGADVAKFKECMTSKRFAKQVEEDIAYGDRIGVRSTPTFFINGELISGAVPLEQFSEVIDEALAETKTN